MESDHHRKDPETVEQIKENKKEIEKKVAKILELIKHIGAKNRRGKNSENQNRKSELIGLVEDFHKQYQSLHAQYDDLRGEVGKISCGGKQKQKKGNFSSSSSSESEAEYYSPDDSDNRSSPRLHRQISERKAENSESVAASTKSEESQIVNEDRSNKEAEQKGQEVQASPAKVKELEAELSTLKIELDSLRDLKKDLEAEIIYKTTEAQQFEKRNIQLQGRITDLEFTSKDKGDEIKEVMQKLQDEEKILTSKIEELIAQVSALQDEVDSLHHQKHKLEESKRKEVLVKTKGLKDQISLMQQELDFLRSQKSKPEPQVETVSAEVTEELKGLKEQVDVLQQELDFLDKRKTELELELDMKTNDLNTSQIATENLKAEMERKTLSEKDLLKDKEDYIMQKEKLDVEVQSLRTQKNNLEELINGKNQEMDKWREEKEGLHARILELEGKLMDKGEQLSTFHKKYKGRDSESSGQIVHLEAQVQSLQEELHALQSEKSKLEMEIEEVKIEMESEILNLSSKIEDQERILTEREKVIKKLTEDGRLLKHYSLDSPRFRFTDSAKLNRNAIERKVEELSDKFHMKMENHLSLLHRRILVAEQMHVETRDNHRKIKEELEQENRELYQKLASCESELAKTSEEILEPSMNLLSKFDLVVNKLDEGYGNFLNRISRISNELLSIKNWIAEKNNEVKEMKQKLDDKEEKESSLKERVWNLEAKLSKEGGDKLNAVSGLERKVVDLEQQLKEKDEELSGLGEEKREAIRQLCMLVDYHRECYDHLKQAMSKMAVKMKRPA